MGRPKGSKNRPKEALANEAAIMGSLPPLNPRVKTNEESKPSVPVETAKPVIQLPEFNPAYEKIFEAPDGTMVVGSNDAFRLWYRTGKKDEGIWILPKR